MIAVNTSCQRPKGVIPINNIDDLRNANLKSGDPIRIAHEALAVFLGEEVFRGIPAIVVIERSPRLGTYRSLYRFEEGGVWYEASCDGEERDAVTYMHSLEAISK